MSLLQVLPPETEVTGDIAAGPPHQVVLHTAALGLVWSDQHIGRDEEGSILCWWHHVVRLVPNSEVLKRFAELTRSELRDERYCQHLPYPNLLKVPTAKK